MDVGAAVVADEQSAALMEPGEGAFHDPAVTAKSGAVLAFAVCNHGFDASPPELLTVLFGVVGAVCKQTIGPASRPAVTTADGRDQVDEWQQLRDVVPVTAGQRPRQRKPATVGQQVVLGARTAPVDRARPDLAAPFFAWIWLESATARDQSSSPAACKSANSTPCSRSQTPASCQTRNLRQQVIPDPKPSCCGRCSHAIPVCNTNKIPHNTLRSSRGLRPG